MDTAKETLKNVEIWMGRKGNKQIGKKNKKIWYLENNVKKIKSSKGWNINKISKRY